MKNYFLKVAKYKMIWTAFLLILFQIGLSVTIPGVHQLQATATNNETFYLSINFSWFMLGISAYMVSSLAITILSSGVSTFFTKWKNGTDEEKNRLHKITTIIALGFSYIIAISYIEKATTDSMYIFLYAPEIIAGLLTIGTYLTIKIGKLIETKGIYNGMSVLVLYNIVRILITNIVISTNTLDSTKMLLLDSTFITVLFYLFIVVVFILGMYLFNNMKTTIPVFNERLGMVSNDSNISISYNSAGFSPLFVTSVVLSILNPMFINSGIIKTEFEIHLLFYLVLIPLYMLCSYKAISPKKKAKSMLMSGLLIPDVAPGEDTRSYLKKKSIVVSLIAVSVIIILDLILLGLSQFEAIRLLQLDTTSLLLCAMLLFSVITRIRLLLINTKNVETLF